MSALTEERLGRLSLRIDAAYCALLGLGVIIPAPLLTEALAMCEPVIVNR